MMVFKCNPGHHSFTIEFFISFLVYYRCPTFETIPSNCRLVADNNDPCCVVPQCNIMPTQATFTGSGQPPATTPIPVVFATPIPGASFTGSNNNVNPQYPNLQTGNNGKISVCQPTVPKTYRNKGQVFLSVIK